MKNKPYLTLSVLIGGIVALALLVEFKGYLGDNIFWLSLVFGLTAYAFTALPVFLPLIPEGTKFHSWVGSLGIAIMGTTVYFVATCLIIVCCNIPVPHVRLAFQFSLHLIALAVMLLTLHFCGVSQAKVEEVAMAEQRLKSTVDELRKRLDDLHYAASVSTGLSPEIRGRIDELCGEARFLTPIGNDDALHLERALSAKIEALMAGVSTNGSDADLKKNLMEAELLMQRRKRVRL